MSYYLKLTEGGHDAPARWRGEDGWVKQRALAKEYENKSRAQTDKENIEVFAPTDATIEVVEA